MDTKRTSARDRLLGAADRLFYAEGVHTVGIDRIIEEAGVAKGSLFYNFSGKDALVEAYLEGRHERRKARIEARFETLSEPRDKLLAIFDVLHDIVNQPGYNGCAFANASAEARSGSVEAMCTATYRAWLRQLILDLSTEAGYGDPEAVTERLVLIFDGATSSSRLDAHPMAAVVAKDLAGMVLDAAA